MVEGAPLLRAYGSKAHRGFESLPLRHTARQFPSVSMHSEPRATKDPDILVGGANRNSTPQFTEIDHCVEIAFLQDAVIDAVDVDEDRSEGVIARFRNAADLAIDSEIMVRCNWLLPTRRRPLITTKLGTFRLASSLSLASSRSPPINAVITNANW